jgi:hypothetical protein
LTTPYSVEPPKSWREPQRSSSDAVEAGVQQRPLAPHGVRASRFKCAASKIGELPDEEASSCCSSSYLCCAPRRASSNMEEECLAIVADRSFTIDQRNVLVPSSRIMATEPCGALLALRRLSQVNSRSGTFDQLRRGPRLLCPRRVHRGRNAEDVPLAPSVVRSRVTPRDFLRSPLASANDCTVASPLACELAEHR